MVQQETEQATGATRGTSDALVGVFDSGVGGLTVVREIFRRLPEESVLYVGDTARVPYGPRGAGTVTRFALELVQFLVERDVKVLVVACNSISSVAIDALSFSRSSATDFMRLPSVSVW